MNKKIDATVTERDMVEIRAALATITQKLPFLVTLDSQERQRLFKMGDKSVGFVEEALRAALNHPSVLPASVDVAAFKRDVELARVLRELQMLTDALAVKISDTSMAVGSEAMTTASSIYRYVQTAAKTEPGLRSVADDLGERFKKLPRQKPTTTEPA